MEECCGFSLKKFAGKNFVLRLLLKYFRVPLLCPCCADIHSSAFLSAAQQASHMMQMREIENLRRSLEKHVSRHLNIRWSIPALKVFCLLYISFTILF